MQAKNSTFAFIDCLKNVDQHGALIFPRGFESKEILSQKVQILFPQERVVLLPFRCNNFFISIAETFWVIAGRNDLAFLSHYLPRAIDYSDDQISWRGGYGPRLRNWHGVDQIKEALRVLSFADTKRCVINIFDPYLDFQESKDIPCTNWLQFIIRDNRIHMNVTLRANDLFWGFSGINTFEWSVLQEMMAFWTNSGIGSMTFFIGSLHVYERHFNSIEKIITHFSKKTLYDFNIPSISFCTSFEQIDSLFTEWFKVELLIRKSPEKSFSKIFSSFEDPFFKISLAILQIYNCFLWDSDHSIIVALINNLPVCDFRVAAIEFFIRKYKELKGIELNDFEKDFFKIGYEYLDFESMIRH